ncbi:uncharacterized protein LOC106170110 [Lingula anatina]|uniref:Uncharacterized protein LOC106170110 n=1 Tax=Lingula anatina TaxID=7574 RepID=A0A1S3J4X0_LINAN|nr:uncharacterized protein LOC106170110 [Lingula anatina]|eukprot:XP_013405311.1 uncharacterized protein LOC106170110 [Lingula anatina]
MEPETGSDSCPQVDSTESSTTDVVDTQHLYPPLPTEETMNTQTTVTGLASVDVGTSSGKHAIGDARTDKSEVNPAKRSKLHTTEPDAAFCQVPVMSPTHKNLLVQMRQMLITDLQVEGIIPDMVASGILSKLNADKIKAQKTEQDQAFEFLCILPKCGPRAFDTFVEVLRKHNKKELAGSLAEKATSCCSKNQIANVYINHMSQIQRLPWDPDDTMHMDDVYVNLQWVQEKREPKGISCNSVESYTSIFKNTEQGKKPKRILVRGKAGIGKTTFTQKMATDWANATLGLKDCNNVLSKYKHLIILNLRSIQPGQTLKEAIEIQIPCSEENTKAVVEETMHALDFDGDQVLLVFDGYDEYDPKTSQEIRDVINRRRYQDVCTIITTRPWKAVELMNRRIMDSVYEITGLTEGNIAQYAANFFDDKETYDEYLKLENMTREEIRDFEEAHDIRIDHFECCWDTYGEIGKGLLGYLRKMNLMSLANIPILLLFICLLWEDSKKDSLLGSYTLLYENLIHLLIRRRHGIISQEKLDEKLGEFKGAFFKLGKLALEGLFKPDGGLVFDEEDLKSIPNISELYSLGLLNKSKVHCNFDVKYQVTFPHKTIQELFAAKYLSWTISEKDHVLDEFLGRLNTLDRLYDMNYVLCFLCGLSEQAIGKVRPRVQELAKMDATLKHIYSPNTGGETSIFYDRHTISWYYPFDSTIADWYIQYFNDLLLEHWYAHCTQESDLTPELAPWHTILRIPHSFRHYDPRFQEVLDNSLRNNKQIWKNVFQDVNTVISDSKPYSWDDEFERHDIQQMEDKTIPLLMMCKLFRNLSFVFWDDSQKCNNLGTDAIKHVLSNAPNLNTLCIDRDFDSSYLSLIQNPANFRNLLVRQWKDLSEAPEPVSEAPEPVDTQILRQMSALKCLHLERVTCQNLKKDIGGQLPFSRGLTHLAIIDFLLTAECVMILGKNLQYVSGLEQIKLEGVFEYDNCPYIDQVENEEHGCPDVCEAVFELGHGVTHTPKLKHFSLADNKLGLHCGITRPLTALVQSLCTVSEQIGMEIDLSRNWEDRVDGLKEQIECIVRSYPHVTLTFKWR